MCSFGPHEGALGYNTTIIIKKGLHKCCNTQSIWLFRVIKVIKYGRTRPGILYLLCLLGNLGLLCNGTLFSAIYICFGVNFHWPHQNPADLRGIQFEMIPEVHYCTLSHKNRHFELLNCAHKRTRFFFFFALESISIELRRLKCQTVI